MEETSLATAASLLREPRAFFPVSTVAIGRTIRVQFEYKTKLLHNGLARAERASRNECLKKLRANEKIA